MWNDFLNKDIQIDFDQPNLEDGKCAFWRHIATAYVIDIYSDFLDRNVPELMEQVVHIDKITEIRVKLTIQVFSGKQFHFVDLLAKASKIYSLCNVLL